MYIIHIIPHCATILPGFSANEAHETEITGQKAVVKQNYDQCTFQPKHCMSYEQQSLEALKLIFIGTRWSRQSATVGDWSLCRVQRQIQRARNTFNSILELILRKLSTWWVTYGDGTQKMEGHMTFHLERKMQNPSTMRQGDVARGENRQ